MRKILFKAKRIDNGEWVHWNVYGELRRESGKRTRLSIEKGATTSYYDYIHQVYQMIDINTICQYTGLTDKNGNKIWENDILMFHSNKNDLAKACYGEFYVVDVETLEKIDTVIGWHYEVIETDAISKYEPFNISMPLTNDYIKTCELEVIGNIFDNKDLIGE